MLGLEISLLRGIFRLALLTRQLNSFDILTLEAKQV